MTWQRILIAGRLQLRFVPQREVQLPVYDFHEQRAVCRVCAHCILDMSAGGVEELLCSVHGLKRTACSLKRAAGESCGPTAALFQPRRAQRPA